MQRKMTTLLQPTIPFIIEKINEFERNLEKNNLSNIENIESDKIPNPVVLKENTFCPIKDIDIDENYRLAWIAKNDKQRHLILFLSRKIDKNNYEFIVHSYTSIINKTNNYKKFILNLIEM